MKVTHLNSLSYFSLCSCRWQLPLLLLLLWLLLLLVVLLLLVAAVSGGAELLLPSSTHFIEREMETEKVHNNMYNNFYFCLALSLAARCLLRV